jgi:hypothetical protein
MSEPAVSNALVRILGERLDDWRALADLALDFAPPHVARAASAAMSDPIADPDAVITAIEAAVPPETDDTPIAIGSIEPETLDFAPVSTISDTVAMPTTEIDLAFGAGQVDAIDLGDHPEAIDTEDEPGDILSVEVHADLPEPEPTVYEHQVVFDDELDRPDESDDDEDLFDVGE